MNVGTLTLEMAANVARLQADMAKATSTVEGAAAKMRAAASNAAKALGAIGAGLSVAGLASFVRGAIDAADETSKLASKIGVTTKEVAGLQLAFRQSGIAPDALTSSMARLAKGLSEGNDGLKALGISSKNTDGTLKTTRQVLGEVANKFQSTGDGITKTARAVEIFGKTGAELIPLLNGGAEGLEEFDRLAAKLGLTIEESTAKQAELFNDTLDLIGQGVQGVGRQVAAQLLPTLTGLASEFFNTATSGDTLKKTADFLASSLKLLYIGGIGVIEVFSSLGRILGGVSAALVAAFQGDFTVAKNILGEMVTDVGAGWKETLGQIDRAWNTTGDSAVSNLARVNKAQMTTKESLDASKKATEEFAKLIKSLQGDLAKSAAESEAAQNGYNKAQQEFIAFARSDVFAKLTNSQKAQVAALFEQKIAIEQNADAQRDFNKALEESEAARVKALTTTDEAIAKLGENNQALREEIELIGLTERQQLAVVQARNDSAIALKAERLALLQKLDIGREEQAQLADEIRLLQERNQLLGQKLGAQEAATTYANLKAEGERFVQDLERGLTDSLFRAFESGKGFFKTLWDGIKNLFKTTVLKAIIQPVVGGITGSLGFAGAANAQTGGGGGISSFLNLGSSSSFTTDGIIKGLTSLSNAFPDLSSATSSLSRIVADNSQAINGLGNTLTGFAIGSGINGAISNGFRVNGTVDTVQQIGIAVASYLGGPLGGAVAGAISGVFNRAFGRKLKDAGVQGTFDNEGFEGNSFQFLKGGVFRSDKTVLGDLDQAIKDQLGGAFKAIQLQTVLFSEALGVNASSVADFTASIKVSTKGLTDEQVAEAFNAELLRISDQLVAATVDLTGFEREGETLTQTLGRLGNALIAVNNTFDTLRFTFADPTLSGADAASKFLDLFGGAEEFGQVASRYYETFFTEAEKIKDLRANVVAQFRRLAETGSFDSSANEFASLLKNVTRENFRNLLSAQDISTQIGRETLKSLLLLSDSFAQLVPEIDSVAVAAAKQAEQQKLNAAAINAERSDRLRIERETAQAAKAAADELAKLNEQNFRLAISAGNVSAAVAARGNTGPRFSDFQGAGGFNAAGYNAAFLSNQQRTLEQVLAETRSRNIFEVSDYFAVIRDLEYQIQSLSDSLGSGEFSGGVSENQRAAEQLFGDFLSSDQIKAAADGLTSFSNILSLVTGTAAQGARGADQALRVLKGAYTGASKNSVEYARGLEIIGKSIGVYSGNIQEIEEKIQGALAGESESFIDAYRSQIERQSKFTASAFAALTQRLASFNTEAQGLETSIDVLDGFIGRLKSVQDAFANAAGDRAAEAGLISGAAQRIARIITTPVAEAARSVLADLPSFANLDGEKLRDISLLIKDLGQFDNAGLEKTFIRISDALASGKVTGEQYADLINYTERVYLGASDAATSLADATSKAADIMREREGLELRILQLQGNTAELRRRELEALDPSNRAFQKFIFLLEDQSRLEADATRLSDAFVSIRDSVRDLIDGLLIDSQRSILSPSQILLEAERQYRENLAGAFEGDTQAVGRLGGSVNALLDAARNNATTEVDFNRTFGRTLGDLGGLESFAAKRATTDDVVAELRAVREELAEVNRELDAQRAELRAGMAQVASNTDKTTKTLEGWTVNGLPATEIP